MKGSAIIIGGTSGLGKELAIEASRRGLNTTIAGRSVNEVSVSEPVELRSVGRWRMDLSGRNAMESGIALPPFFGEAVAQGPRYVIWTAGILQRAPLVELTDEEIDQMVAVHLSGPMKVLSRIHRHMVKNDFQYMLVVVSSTSAYRLRNGEEAYCAVKSGKSHFARQWAVRMRTDHPGSQVLLVQPGGMKTPAWNNIHGVDPSLFMDSRAVALRIWDQAWDYSTKSWTFREVTINRLQDGRVGDVEIGTMTPEHPNSWKY